jgi:erythromycin esterase-like protein
VTVQQTLHADVTLGEALRTGAYPVSGSKKDYDPLLDLTRNARLVLLGEASHGTHEFYRERARITRRLIEEQGFQAVAVEADWPDAYRVNRWVQGAGDDRTALESLGSFERFPRWMWRNRDVLEFVRWLQDYNRRRQTRVGFYGLDLYSLYGSMEEVVRFLDQVDPEAASRARYRYSCFDAYGEDSQAYGYAAEFDLSRSREDQAVQQLLELQRCGAELARLQHLQRDGDRCLGLGCPGRAKAGAPRAPGELRGAVPRHRDGRLPSQPARQRIPPRGISPVRLERAIGVIYRPESERVSHYFEARLPDQFDAVVHFDVTRAVEPSTRARDGAWRSLPKPFLPACDGLEGSR